LRRNAPGIGRSGPILNRSGQALGDHQGLAYYTIGQRKGLGVASTVPLYVLEKDVVRNTLIVGTEDELGSTTLLANGINWIAGEPPTGRFHAEVKTRYTAKDAPAKVTPIADRKASVLFDLPQRDITPGQAAVFYMDNVVLGGGIIE
jgi:tRNA-specific 2-thiouridylase